MNIGRIHVDSRLVLAPMAGVTDLAFRQICRELGAGLTVTEMVSAKALCYQDRKTRSLLRLGPGEHPAGVQIFGSDVAHRMVDFAQRNAERAGVAHAVQLRGGDALQRMPPTAQPGVLLMNPPYGERIAAAGVAGQGGRGREAFQSGTLARQRTGTTHAASASAHAAAEVNAGDEFFTRLAAHWKSHYAGWTAWLLTPDLKLPGRLRLKESRRVPLWNGPIECRLFRFDLTARRADFKPDQPLGQD